MGAYLPVIVWIISAVICEWIAARRNVKLNLPWRLLVVFLGPFAIPFIFLAKPGDVDRSTE
mgnify:CR=1 FL=1